MCIFFIIDNFCNELYFLSPKRHFFRTIEKCFLIPISLRLSVIACDDPAIVFRHKEKLIESVIECCDILRIHPFAIRRVADVAATRVARELHILH